MTVVLRVLAFRELSRGRNLAFGGIRAAWSSPVCATGGGKMRLRPLKHVQPAIKIPANKSMSSLAPLPKISWERATCTIMCTITLIT